MNENIFMQVKSYMKSKFYSFNETWLRECVQYCVETHPKLSVEGIQSFAGEQWLLSNLREINNESGSLPKNLTQQKCTILFGRYVLQIEKMYDISTSKYKQLEKIRNVNVANLKDTDDVESQSSEREEKRMYQLFLTDGVQEIQAIEYKPVSFFNKTILPGYKLMIIGPVTCRRGIIMLEEKHISGLGGEIEDLLIPNSLENILARSLNLKENPDPYNDIKRKEQSEKSDSEEFEEYLDHLEKLARDQEAKENRRPSLSLNSSVLTLQSNSKINLQTTSTEQNIDEFLTEDELQALINDPDIVDEFPLVKSISNPVNLEKLGQKTSFKVPSLPSSKLNQKKKLSTENSNQVSQSAKNLEFQDDSFSFDDKNGELSGSWDSLKETSSGCYKMSQKTTQKVEIVTKVPKPESLTISEFQDDDLLLDDEDLIILDSWESPKAETSHFFKPPYEKSRTVQILKSSNNGLEIEKSSNGKDFEPKKNAEPSQSYKPLFSKSSSDADLEIKNLGNNSKGWRIISNEMPTANSKEIENPKSIALHENLERNTSLNKNMSEPKNSFGISKPYKPLFPKQSSIVIEKSTNDDIGIEMKKLGNEPNKSLETLNTNLDLRMKKLLNEPTNNLRGSSNSSAESTFKIKNTDLPLRLGTGINGSGLEEFITGSKRPASPILPLMIRPKIHCGSDSTKEKITPRNEELPPKICDFICDLIKEPLSIEVIYKTVRAKIKEKGKLSHKGRRWNLDGLISDGTANLKVEFSSEFMDSILGCNALDFSLIKKEAKDDPKLKERIVTNMRNAQHKLEQSDWLMQLEMAQNKTPVVLNATELTEKQRTVFEKRLQILKPQYI